jgi:hypothetical protein
MSLKQAQQVEPEESSQHMSEQEYFSKLLVPFYTTFL